MSLEKIDWKLERAYEILGLPFANQAELDAEFEILGEIQLTQFEEVIATISQEYYDKVMCLRSNFNHVLDNKERLQLERKAFISYKDFLRQHELKYLDWRPVKNPYRRAYDDPKFIEPDAVYDLHDYLRNNLLVTNEQDYEDFCKNYPPNISGYLKLLSNSSAKKLNSFFLQSKLWCYVRARDRAKHTYITGSSGSGKSELIKFITFSELKKEHRKGHIVLIDPNGDLAEQTVKMALVEGIKYKDIVYFDPFLHKDYTPCINPLQTADKSERNIDRLSQELCKVFSAILKADAGLSTQMEALFTPCVATLLREGRSSFVDLQNFVDSEDIAAPYLELGKESPFLQHRRFFENKFKEAAYKQTKTSIYTKLQSLLNSAVFVNTTTGQTTIDLFKILNEKTPKLVIFKLSKGSMGSEASEALGRCILGLISVLALQRDGQPENARVPVNLTVDEFQNYVGGKILKEGLTELRKYKIAYTLACQYPNQIDTDTQNAVFANTNVKLVGQQQDPRNIALLSRMLSCTTEEIKALGVGHFIGKVGEKPYFELSVPDITLKTHTKIFGWNWNRFVSYQLEHYYQPKGDLRPIFGTDKKQEQLAHKDREPHIKKPLFTEF